MTFKKSLLSVAVLMTTMGFNLSANAAEQNTANVTLSGLISAVTCDIDVNGISGGTTVNTGMHLTGDFASTVNDVTGTPVPMVVTLKNCGDKNSEAGTGNLYISGTTAPNGNNNIFVGNDADTGFMVLNKMMAPFRWMWPVILMMAVILLSAVRHTPLMWQWPQPLPHRLPVYIPLLSLLRMRQNNFS